MELVTGDRYLESLVKFVEKNAGGLIEGTLVLKLNPVGLHYVQSRLEALHELERLISGAPVDYLRAYVSDLGDHRALEQLRRILCRLSSLKVVSVLPPPSRDPTPLSLLHFGRLKVLELRGCDLSTPPAKGLLELRHSLEKLICHNSTDALRHVFASRIADIKESPQWNRLSLVSCACNGLILMDESLQLLPAVETLDLSRNKFAKVDNLRKCTRLAHLDLGFNQLRSLASFSEVTSHISKLVLRSNALTTLRGIENLKSLEGLDISYNIISNYLELEVLSSLQSLKNLWLEGNPLCSARWYRPLVFSFLAHPEKVKLDDREMITREFWKRQIIVARRQRRPASYGFYSAAREDIEGPGLTNGKRKKLSRLACIENEEHGMNTSLDQDSLSCDDEIQGGDDNFLSDNEGEITRLINRIELMKKERSMLWLEGFKDWMDRGSENWVDGNRNYQAMLAFNKGSCFADKTSLRHIGESSRYPGYVSGSIIASGDDSSTILESNSSFAGSSAGNHGCQWLDYNSVTAGMNVQGGDKDASFSIMSLTAINNIIDSRSCSVPPGSPPYYQEDILHRRHDLEEEFLQLSAESFSIASSDSDTSGDEDVRHEHELPGPNIEQFVCEELLAGEKNWHSSLVLEAKDDKKGYVPEVGQDGGSSLDLCAQGAGYELHRQEYYLEMSRNEVCPRGDIDEDVATSNRCCANHYGKTNSKRKPRKRVVSLLEENSMCFCRDDIEDWQKKHTLDNIDGTRRACVKVNTLPALCDADEILAQTKNSALKTDHIEKYFSSYTADSTIQETCEQYIVCNCVVERETEWRERQVAVILSSEQKLYLLLDGGMLLGPGNSSSVLSSHKIEQVSEVLVGLGLQVVRFCIDEDASYLFITKSMEKTMDLLCMLGLISQGQTERCSLWSLGNFIGSLEQIQVDLFDRQICGGLGINIYQYSMVLFWQNCNEEEEWVCRSLFVNGRHLFVCIEDVLHFSLLSTDTDAAQYFLLDSCCSVDYVSEMVIDANEKQCVTLTLKTGPKEHCLSAVADTIKVKVGFQDENTATRAKTWKLKWFSAESLFQFVALLKAIHGGMATSGLSVKYVS